MQFYLTPEHACGYLKDKQARTAFADPDKTVTVNLYSQLIQHGFRRDGKFLYTPDCKDCKACQSSRVVTEAFTLNKRFKRISKKNEDLTVEIEDLSFNRAHYALFARYLEARHQDGEMWPTSEQQYKDFLLSSTITTKIITFKSQEMLRCVAFIDFLTNGISAVYTFFDPDYADNSLGTYAVLWQIAFAKTNKIPYVYLGFWIEDSPKMAYKKDFMPLEIFHQQQWRRLKDTRKL